MNDARPHGSWTSPIRAARLSSGSLRLSQPRPCEGAVYWLEARPAEGGRQVVMRVRGDASPEAVTPEDVGARSRVHEYGGGDYAVWRGVVVVSDDASRRVLRIDAPGAPPVALTDGTARYGDLEVSPDGRWVVAVEERPVEPTHRLVAFPLDRAEPPREVASGFDFVSSPRFAPGGDRLAFTAWNHPDMPWDATELWEVAWRPEGPGARARVAGDARESIVQPGYSPEGRLTFVSDRSGWWNLEQIRDGRRLALRPTAAEFGRPQWALGMSTWAFECEDRLLCAVVESGRHRLLRIDLPSGGAEDVPLPFDVFEAVRVADGLAALVAAGAARPPAVVRLDPASGAHRVVREAFAADLAPGWISRPEAVSFPATDAAGARVHAFLYRPANPSARAPSGERPPLLVKCHGGPTGAASPSLDLALQFWTSRGFAVVDVDYRGSTGYGRAYRDALRGAWGVRDVEDCVAAARFAADEGVADPARLGIRGSSAGGYTVLCALTFHDAFAVGASYYGIGDLEALARDTHEFEAHYLDRLVGPYPERRDLYRARSPVRHADRLSCPVIFFQGLEDPVVTPAQAEAMVDALAARGIPHAYVTFEGEPHGFRRAESQRDALECELAFYGHVLGFEPDVPRPDLVIRGR